MASNLNDLVDWIDADIVTKERLNIVNDSIRYLENSINTTNTVIDALINKFYPIGTIFTTTNESLNTPDAVARHIGGKWEVFGAGRVIVGAGNNYNNGKIGGSDTVVLSSSELPSHSHDLIIDSHNHKFNNNEHSHTVTVNKHKHTATQTAHSHTFDFRLRKPGQQSEWHPQAANGNHNNGVDSATYNTNSSCPSISVNDTELMPACSKDKIEGSIENTTATGKIKNTGGGIGHNNMQPYVVCYQYKRVS